MPPSFECWKWLTDDVILTFCWGNALLKSWKSTTLYSDIIYNTDQIRQEKNLMQWICRLGLTFGLKHRENFIIRKLCSMHCFASTFLEILSNRKESAELRNYFSKTLMMAFVHYFFILSPLFVSFFKHCMWMCYFTSFSNQIMQYAL